MRELAPWASRGDVGSAFEDIEALTEDCRFRDCTHTVEEGCAVLAAVDLENISEKRYRNYCKLQKELAYLNDTEAYREKKERTMKLQRQYYDKVFKGRKKGTDR
jgi:ribosome biogenesis GTPase